MEVFIKVKIKELAEEARVIRKEELKAKSRRDTSTLNQLHEHRIHRVRPAARAAQLAYGYIRGRSYRSMEQTVRADNPPDWKEVARLVRKYGPEEYRETDRDVLDAWSRA